ncbi:uncharacterized protein LOC144747746 [Ciona intestinalis]
MEQVTKPIQERLKQQQRCHDVLLPLSSSITWNLGKNEEAERPAKYQRVKMTTRARVEALRKFNPPIRQYYKWLKEFEHFGYPHTIVLDNAQAFMPAEFQHRGALRRDWSMKSPEHRGGIVHLTGVPHFPATNGAAERLVNEVSRAQRGIVHLTGVPHFPATNGAAERLVNEVSQTPLQTHYQEFLLQYRRIPNASGFSPSELLNGRQLRTKIDTLLPSPAHVMQGSQTKPIQKSQGYHLNLKLAIQVMRYTWSRAKTEGRWVPETSFSPRSNLAPSHRPTTRSIRLRR